MKKTIYFLMALILIITMGFSASAASPSDTIPDTTPYVIYNGQEYDMEDMGDGYYKAEVPLTIEMDTQLRDTQLSPTDVYIYTGTLYIEVYGPTLEFTTYAYVNGGGDLIKKVVCKYMPSMGTWSSSQTTTTVSSFIPLTGITTEPAYFYPPTPSYMGPYIAYCTATGTVSGVFSSGSFAAAASVVW